jgi:hypothetical protein
MECAMSFNARATVIAGLMLGLILAKAHAVPSYARQTGYACNVCHTNPPELTAIGRDFKLKGYGIPGMALSDKIGDGEGLSLTKNIPVSAMVLLSNTSFQANQPGTQNNAAGFPQQLSLFLAGSFVPHFGGFAQVTYTHSDDHFGMDNADFRFANHGTIGKADVDYGITVNNNPTVQDIWNSTPAWGFPWISSPSALDPIATPVINGGLAADVAGAGGYAMWANHFYTEATVYRSEHAGASTPITGQGAGFNISGIAPYWRAAWQQDWGSNYLMVGTYGMYLNSFPGAVSGSTDRYIDSAFDFQYQRQVGKGDEFDMHGTYIHEKSNLGATFAAEGADAAKHHLEMFKADALYHWRGRFSVAGQFFSIGGAADPVLYGVAPLTGSNNGSPASNGYIAQFAYWPVQNMNLNLNYSGYTKFNGAKLNYDGASRNASDNNTVYVALWFMF